MINIKINSNRQLLNERFTPNESIIQHNYKIIEPEFKDYTKYVIKIPQLQVFQLEKFLGSGSWGSVFLFKHGFVIKIYREPQNTPNVYDAQMQKLHITKNATLSDLNIIAKGEVDDNLKYVIINKLIVLEDYLHKTIGYGEMPGFGQDILEVNTVEEYYTHYLHTLQSSIKKFAVSGAGYTDRLKKVLEFCTKNKQFILGLTLAVQYILNEYNITFPDIATANIGLMPMSDGSIEFVPFDIH